MLFVLITWPALAQSDNQVLSLNTIIRGALQSDDGFIWLATSTDVLRWDGHELLSLDDLYDSKHTAHIKQIKNLYKDPQGQLWIGTQNNGVFYITAGGIHSVHNNDFSKQVHNKIIQFQGWMWSVTNEGLLRFNESEWHLYAFKDHPQITKDGYIMDLDVGQNRMYVLKTNQLIEFDPQQQAYNTHTLPDAGLYRSMWVDDGFTMSADQGVFHSTDLKSWENKLANLSGIKVRATHAKDNQLWVISIFDGIRLYDADLNLVTHFHEDAKSFARLSSNSVTDVFIDHSGLVWVLHFNGAVDTLDLKRQTFGLNQLSSAAHCNLNESHLDMTEDDQHYWIASQSGIQRINKQTGQCDLINQNASGEPVFASNVPTTIAHSPAHGVLIGGSNGIHQIGESGVVEPFNAELRLINFITESQGLWFCGGLDGLFQIDLQRHQVNPINGSEDIEFYDLAHSSNTNAWYFASNQGLFRFQDGQLDAMESINQQLGTSIIHAVYAHDAELYVALAGMGLVQIDLITEHIQLWSDSALGTERNALEIIGLGDWLWISTDDGLIRTRLDGTEIRRFSEHNGLQSDGFIRNAGHLTEAGQLFFGGVKGYNFFDPAEIAYNQTPPRVNFTRLKRFNEPVLVAGKTDDFELNQELNQLDKLVLTHRDYVMAFEFAAMDFTSPRANQYQHRLFPFEEKWNLTQASQRMATYTNLPSGAYELQVKASNNEGIWSQSPEVLNIKVLPPPWLTWWALTSYVLMALGAVYWYVQHKIKTNQRIADRLRIEVAEKTKELSIQKQTVESLLEKKNELFSNVSHEFRTPLTLILGPIRELLDKQTDQADVKSLTMINRSANRLLSLVEQLLQIARVSDLDKVKTQAQNTENQVASLVESFEHMAHSKRIKLQLTHNDPATIDVTDQFIDAVLGNLVSNAIKYTQSGGSVWVSATASSDSLILSVKDTGAGLTADQQQDIFKRFRRLESHQAIEGIGIGLSVVEEVVKVNNGQITVDSELGVGSEFVVRVPLAEAVESQEQTHISTLVQQLQRESVEVAEAAAPSADSAEAPVEDVTLNTVLVIEDNHDMRQHIVDIISPHYNCLTAENGVKGVAAAIEQVPDIIISDVMMPEMDGFKVARIIRADERTSHIPLMLLTALNDKTSRIKGWRENVDAYMTKPFDRDELLIQLENMLTIRDILKKKAGQDLSSGQSQSATLTKKDQEFVDRLMGIIHEHYADPLLSRVKLANLMAVSDRQLQRKIKALIDQNPMDILREFRLNTAKQKLRDGYQVSLVADDCGFNSLSYFSQCFKAQFGMSPKKFQQSQ